MKRIIMLAAAGASIATAVAVALFRRRRHQEFHSEDLAGPDVIIDEVVVHFNDGDVLLGF